MSTQDAIREIARMKTLARDIWLTERSRLTVERGPGFARFSDKRSAGMMRNVVDELLRAGCEWSDIEKGIKNAASDPRCSPWSAFDRALAAMDERLAEFRQRIERDAMRTRAPRVTRGLRSIGDIVR